MGQHMGDMRQLRDSGALTTHYAQQHQFKGFNRNKNNNRIQCQPMWLINNSATKDLIETAAIEASNIDKPTLNKDKGPAATTLTNELARTFQSLNVHNVESGAIGWLEAAPTVTRNNIRSTQNQQYINNRCNSTEVVESSQQASGYARRQRCRTEALDQDEGAGPNPRDAR
jgi:hypothetical protein